MVAGAFFCSYSRQDGKLRLYFEKETDDSVLLFNHRNKIPGSENRNIRLKQQNPHDGVEFQYVSNEDGAVLTYYIPDDMSARNPKKVESVGISNKIQAHFHAWRVWNKIRYQNTTTEFEALQEADPLIIKNRILVADNTRAGTQDGQVENVSGLTLTLSQPVTFAEGKTYTIFLQHGNGTVQAIGITAGGTNKQVILSEPPTYTLPLLKHYWIVADDDPREQAFLLTEKKPANKFTYRLQAINYDARYYQNDLDYINEVIDENGEMIV